MGTALLGIVARRRNDTDLNNNSEVGECAYKSKQVLLLETPPLGIRHTSKTNLRPELLSEAAKIGKIARIPERKIRDEHQQVIVKVSHRPGGYFPYHLGSRELANLSIG